MENSSNIKEELIDLDSELNEDTQVCRYLSLPKFLSMYESGGWFFPSASDLAISDPYEGSYSCKEITKAVRKSNELDANRIKNFIINSRKVVFLSSWNISKDENNALWGIYGNDNNSILIQTSLKQLKDFLSQANLSYPMIIRKIEYKKIEEIDQENFIEDDLLNIYTRKHMHYDYEKEIRFLFSPIFKKSNGMYTVREMFPKNLLKGNIDKFSEDLRQKNQKPEQLLKVQDVHFFNHIEKMVIHPNCDEFLLSSLNKLLEKDKRYYINEINRSKIAIDPLNSEYINEIRVTDRLMEWLVKTYPTKK